MTKEHTPNLPKSPSKLKEKKRKQMQRATESKALCKMGDYKLLLKLQFEDDLLMYQ